MRQFLFILLIITLIGFSQCDIGFSMLHKQIIQSSQEIPSNQENQNDLLGDPLTEICHDKSHCVPGFTTVNTNGLGPLPRGTWGNAVVSDSTALFFGGVVDNIITGINVFFNDTWLFNRLEKDSGVWTELFPTVVPSARAFQAMARVTDKHGNAYACMFGGTVFSAISSTPSADKFYCYNVTSQNWLNFTSLGGPSPRSGSSAVGRGPNFYVLMGVSATLQTLNDIWRFNIDTRQWTNLTPAHNNPPPRHVAIAEIVCPNNDHHGHHDHHDDHEHIEDCDIVMYGGENITFSGFRPIFDTRNDTWEFNLRTNQWRNITNNCKPTPPVDYACTIPTVSELNIYMFGGENPGSPPGCRADHNPINTVWKFRSSNDKWTLVPTKALGRPPGIKRQTCARFDNNNDMYIFGGFSVFCDGPIVVQEFNEIVYRLNI